MIASLKEKEDFLSYENKLIFTKIENHLMSFYLEGNTLIEADIADIDQDGQQQGILNNIYIGKVKHVVKNLNAAFVEYKPGVMGFLSMEKWKAPILLNRTYHGGLSAGDELLVQVEREPVKTKDAVLTTHLTLCGTYVVFSTEDHKTGFSNKLSRRKKEFLKEALQGSGILEQLEPEFSLILRTNAETLSKDTIGLLFDEIQTLKKHMEALLNKAKTRPAYTLLYQDKSFPEKKAQDTYVSRIDRIITDDEETYKLLSETENISRLSFYKDDMLSLKNLYGLGSRIEEAFHKKVWLKSGGYLVIEPTEALTVIDVNSGKCVDKKKRQEMFFKVNMEAAKEAARQIRLRNLSGIILIDFINLEEDSKEEELLSFFREQCKKDPVQTQVIDMTALGLLEVTRKKVAAPLFEKCGKLFSQL